MYKDNLLLMVNKLHNTIDIVNIIININYKTFCNYENREEKKNLTLSNEIANMVNIDPCATTNSTNGTVLPVFFGIGK